MNYVLHLLSGTNVILCANTKVPYIRSKDFSGTGRPLKLAFPPCKGATERLLPKKEEGYSHEKSKDAQSIKGSGVFSSAPNQGTALGCLGTCVHIVPGRFDDACHPWPTARPDKGFPLPGRRGFHSTPAPL